MYTPRFTRYALEVSLLGILVTLLFPNVTPAQNLYVVEVHIPDFSQFDNTLALEIQVINRFESKITAIVDEAQLELIQRNGYSVKVRKPSSALNQSVRLSTLSSSLVLDNGRVGVSIDYGGTFTMWRSSDNKWLLYPAAGTGYLSVSIDGEVYTNVSDFSQMSIVEPLSQISENSASITYETPQAVRILQILELRDDALCLSTGVENHDFIEHDVKIRHLIDTQIDDNDGSPLYAPPTGTRTYETDIPNVNFTTWEAWLTPESPSLKGVGTLADIPARMVFAWWPDAYDYPWDYTPNPNQRFYTPGYTTSPESDSCVLLYFSLGNIGTHTSALPVVTNYGIGAPSTGNPSDQLRTALLELYDAVSNYIYETGMLYAHSVAPSYKDLVADASIRSFAIDLTKDLLSSDIARIIGRMASKGAIKGAQKALELTLENLVENGLIDVFPSATIALLETINPAWDETQIQAYIASQTLGSNGWNLNGNKGVNALLESLHQEHSEFVASIPDTLPEGYPVASTIRAISHITDSIRRHTPFNNQLTPEGKIYWHVPGICDFEVSPFNPMIVGNSSNAARFYNSAVTAYKTEGMISEARTYGCMAWVIGGGAIKVVSFLGGATALPAEALYWSGVGVCGTAGTAMGFVDLATKLALWYELVDFEAKVASDILMISDFYRNVLAKAKFSITEEDYFLCSTQIEIKDIYVPNLDVGLFDDVAEGVAEITVENLDDSRLAATQVVMEIFKEGASIGYYGSGTHFIQPGSSRTLTVYFAVPNSILFLTDRYMASFIILTSAGVFNRSTGFNVRSPIAEFVDRTEEIMNDIIEAGQSIVEDVFTQSSTEQVQFALSYPGSDLDLHIYDQYGNHVGVNYQTGEQEVTIPGASYSGFGSNPEIITIESPGNQQFTVKVVAIATYGTGSFSVLMVEEESHPATLSVSPNKIVADARIPGVFNTTITLGEIGGHNGIDSIEASATNITSLSGGVIGSSNISINLASDAVEAGSAIMAGLTVNIPEGIPSGEYEGSITFQSSANSINVPVSLHLLSGLELYAGWNLMSLPLQPPNTEPSAVLSHIDTKYNSVWTYDPQAGWSIYAPGVPSNLEEMIPSRGYWIKMDEHGTLPFEGTVPETTAIFLEGGEWNLAGYSSLVPKDVESCMSSVAGDINSVWEYTSGAGWSIYTPGGPSDLEVMKPGYGYWIRADRDCTWDVSAATALAAPPLSAKLRKTDVSIDRPGIPYRVWGRVEVNGVDMTGKSNCAVILKVDDKVQSSYGLGAIGVYGDCYVLDVPADTANGASQAELWVQIGDAIVKANALPPAEPGQVLRLDLSVRLRPKVSFLHQNYPNPFNPDTWIPYQLKEETTIEVRIYTLTGQLVRTLNLGHKPAGFYTGKDKAAYWDGKNEAGEEVSSGIYFYSISAGDFSAIRKMVIRK